MSTQYLQTHTIPAAHPTDIFSLAVTPAHLLTASGSSSIRIYSTQRAQVHAGSPVQEDPYPLVQVLEKAHGLGCHHVVASGDGGVAASAGFAGEVKVWELGGGEEWGERGQIVVEGKKAGEHWALALNESGQYLASTTHDGRINVYDTADVTPSDPKRKKPDPTPVVTRYATKASFGLCLDISPSGEMTASGHQNGSIYIFNNSTSRLAHSLSGLIKPVRSVSFSPANKYLAAAGDARVIALYDCQSGEQVANLTGHASWIMGVTWNWSGEFLLSGSYDGKAKVWSLERRGCIATQTESEKCLWSVAWLPKAASARNEMFVTAGAGKTLAFYREASGT